jgi:type IV secretory pathway ATPase VirB11/archaellum biosynthesis ATPase
MKSVGEVLLLLMIPEQVRDVTVVHTASLIVPIPSPTIWYFSSSQSFSSYLEVFLFDVKF